MKNIVVILSVVTLLATVSCKNREKAGNTDASTADASSNAKQGNTTDKKSRLIVSFKSIGTGIDGEAQAKMEKFVKEHPKKPQYQVYSWGREGERDYAFSLKEIKAADQAKFIEDLKAAIGKSDRVDYKENEVPAGRTLKTL